MNTNLILVLSLAGAVYAQAESANSHLDRLSPKAREFVEKYKAEKASNKINGKMQQKKVVLKNDVLGRKIKNGHLQDTTVYYITKDETEPKMEVLVTDLTVEDVDIEPISAQYSYNGESKEEHFWLNGKKTDKESFFKKSEDWEQRRAKKHKPLKKPYKAFLTPTQIEDKLLSSKNIYIDDDNYIAVPNYVTGTTYVPGNGTYTINFASPQEALNTSQLNYAHASGYKGNGIGIYYMEGACADATRIPNPSKHKRKKCGNSNNSDDIVHATAVTDILQLFAPSATVYGYDDSSSEITGPDNPMSSSFNPKIYIGSVSMSWYYDQYTSQYENFDAAFDNYIYNTGVTEFIVTGNILGLPVQPQPTVVSPGKAVNAITVGAADPKKQYNQYNTYGYRFAPYNSYLNSNLGNTKPDILNLAQFYGSEFPSEYGNTFHGTSAAAPFSAAMAADLMSKHPFFKGHPEMVKPVFLTTTTSNTIYNWDTDGGAVQGIPAFNLMASNKSYSGYWQNANYATLFKDANGNKKYIEINLINVVAGEKYKLAISWLMKGETIRAMNRLPIHMAVGVFQNQNLLSVTSSATPNEQPYTLQTFTAPQSGTITIRIACENDAPNDPMTFGYHMALVP